MEFEGTSEQEAVEKACSALKLAEGDLDYTVIDEGSGGVFGLGARPVQIKVRVPEGTEVAEAPAAVAAPASEADAPKETEGGRPSKGLVGPTPEKAESAREVAQGLADKMGVTAKVTVRDEHEQIVVVVEEVEGSTDVVDILGKSRPPAIPSFQFLLNKIVNRFPDDRKHIVVEVPSVPRRERRPPAEKKKSEPRQRQPVELDPDLDPALVELARSLAERASSLNKVITVHPMLAADRRAVHQTITTIDGVQTVSEGEGLYRKMHVVPDAMMGGTKKRRRRRRRRRDEESNGAEEGAPTDEKAPDAPTDEATEAVEAEASTELQETQV